MEKKTDIIIGAGEVGKALFNIMQETCILRDIEYSGDPPRQTRAIHICFPFNVMFKEQVRSYILKYRPDITIIHSTVEVGTTRDLPEPIVHSPVRGKHPRMETDMKTYIKYIGYNKHKSLLLAKSILGQHFRIEPIHKTESTELGKLLSLARYGLGIAFADEQNKICKQFGVSYNKAVTQFERTRNAGLETLKKDYLRQPELSPPDGKIGGHCVVENAAVLNQQYESNFLEEIINLT